MRRFPRDPAEEFEELRRLLLSREREQLRNLREQITDKDRRSNDVAAILPEAVRLSRNQGEELSRALQPTVEDSIKEWIRKDPDTFVDTFGPVIGSALRRSVGESFRRFLRSIRQALGHAFSWRRLKWRFEALRTGRTVAEVEMQQTLVYRVEELFLIHRETGISLLHVSADPEMDAESKVIKDMLSAIQEFAHESFRVSTGSALVEFRAGPLQVWIALGRYAYLAAVIRGTPSRELRSSLEKTIDTIHVLKGSALASFRGDTSVFQSLRPELQSCLRSHYATRREGRSSAAWMAFAVAAALAVFATIQAIRSELNWKSFLDRLNAQPGIIITEARKGWFSHSRISGLRDASTATNPAPIAREEKVNPAGIDFQWKDYLASDSESMIERFKKRFGIPAGAYANIADGVLTISGTVPYEWLERVRREATLLPGISSIVDRDTEVTYDPGSVITRFEEKIGLPETVHAVFAKGVLTLSGAAPHKWLTRMRSDASKIPGINSVDDQHVIDLDQRAFQHSKSVLEDASVNFVPGKDEVAPESFIGLSRFPEQITRLGNAAKQIGIEITLEIQGFADSSGEETKQPDLAQRRANKVRDFLISCGFQADGLKPVGIEQPPSSPDGQKPAQAQSGRRVGFKVISRESAAPQ
jgi:outer membrane protein OmpA-like peptidoglycan-associated protein